MHVEKHSHWFVHFSASEHLSGTLWGPAVHAWVRPARHQSRNAPGNSKGQPPPLQALKHPAGLPRHPEAGGVKEPYRNEGTRQKDTCGSRETSKKVYAHVQRREVINEKHCEV